MEETKSVLEFLALALSNKNALEKRCKNIKQINNTHSETEVSLLPPARPSATKVNTKSTIDNKKPIILEINILISCILNSSLKFIDILTAQDSAKIYKSGISNNHYANSSTAYRSSKYFVFFPRFSSRR
jgi:hypothetical protein